MSEKNLDIVYWSGLEFELAYNKKEFEAMLGLDPNLSFAFEEIRLDDHDNIILKASVIQSPLSIFRSEEEKTMMSTNSFSDLMDE